MFYFFKKGKNATEMQKEKRCVQCMDKMLWLTDRMCQKWFAKFHAGVFSLGDTPKSGRPVEVGNNQIDTLNENNQHYITQEIADIQNIKINKVIGENEKCVFYFMEITTDFLANPIYLLCTC